MDPCHRQEWLAVAAGEGVVRSLSLLCCRPEEASGDERAFSSETGFYWCPPRQSKYVCSRSHITHEVFDSFPLLYMVSPFFLGPAHYLEAGLYCTQHFFSFTSPYMHPY